MAVWAVGPLMGGCQDPEFPAAPTFTASRWPGGQLGSLKHRRQGCSPLRRPELSL